MLGTITLTVGQTDSVSQKEDSPEAMEVVQEEVAPQVNGEKEEKQSADADEVTAATEEEKSAQESPQEANEVGFKKIFRFVGFKFTLKKDKNEKVEPVQLLTVEKKEEAAEASSSEVAEEPKEEVATEEAQPVEEEKAAEEPATSKPTAELVTEGTPTEKVNGDAIEQAPKEEEPREEASPEKEAEPAAESPTTPAVQEPQSSLRRFFTGGIFSNLRKKTSFKKTKEEEAPKEKTPEEDIKETEETTEPPAVEAVETPKEEVAPEAPQEEPATPKEAEAELTSEAKPIVAEELVAEEEAPTEEEPVAKAETTTEEEPAIEAIAPVTVEQEVETAEADVPPAASDEVAEGQPAEVTEVTNVAEDAKLEEEKVESSAEGQAIPEEVPAATAEPELLSSQEKAKVQGSPLKKLFSGSGLKKISSKKHKAKKEAEAKLTESGEQVAEQLQSSTESAEGQKGESSASSPDESGEHVVSEATTAEASQENEGEAATSDGERKKDGILPWSSFKKLVTPKKRVKRPSESEDEGAEKPKSSTLSSTESAEKPEEPKPVEEEQKVMLEQSTEEPKKKMDTSVSWEALICVGSSKKRARKTSDSDDEAPRIEEEVLQSGQEVKKPAESPLGSSQEADNEHVASSPEPAGSPSDGEGVSTWESLKRFVTPRRKAKAEDKTDESTGTSGAEPMSSDGEIPKEESTFSLKKLIPGRRKKKAEGKQEQASSDEAGKDVGSAEEDSDTPAVVPLSEYDNVETEKVETAQKEEAVTTTVVDTTEAEVAKPEPEPEPEVEKPSEVVPAAAADERSPSWISTAVVEDIQESTTECTTKHQQLSDIPEEGDTVATPKSATEDVSRDDTIAEDIVDLASEVVTAMEQVPEMSIAEETTEMVSAVSRLTESPGTSGETTPVPGEDEKKIEVVLQEVVETVTVESHQQSQATTISTGLESQEIESVEEETLVASVESITKSSEVTTMEAVAEPLAEVTMAVEAAEEPAKELREVNEIQEHIEAMVISENTPKVEVEEPAEITVGESVCNETTVITEDPILECEKVQELDDVQQSLADAELALVEEVVEVITQEVITSVPEPLAMVEIQEAPISVVEPVSEIAVVHETVSIICPLSETIQSKEEEVPSVQLTDDNTIQVEVKDMEEVSAEPILEAETEAAPTGVTAIEVVLAEVPAADKLSAEVAVEAEIEAASTTETAIEGQVEVVEEVIELVAEPVVEAEIEAASTNMSAVVEEVCEMVEEVKETTKAEQGEEEAIEEQSTVIVQTVIQGVFANLSETVMESEPESQVQKTEAATPEATKASEEVLTIVAEAAELPGESKAPETTGDSDAQLEPPTLTEEAVGDAVAVGGTGEEVKEKSEVVEVSEEEKPPAVSEKPAKQIQEAMLVIEVRPIEDEQVLTTEEICQETASEDVEGGSKQVAELDVKEEGVEEVEEADVLEEQIEIVTECLNVASQESGETKVDGKLEGQEETEKPDTQTPPGEEAQSERDSEKSESKAETESEVKGEEEVPEAKIPKDAEPSQDFPAEEVVVTEEVPVIEVPSQTEGVASTMLETNAEALYQDKVSEIKPEPEPQLDTQTTDSQTPAETAEAKTEESGQKETTGVVQSEVVTADGSSKAQVDVEEIHVAEEQSLQQIQAEVVEEISFVNEKAQAGDKTVLAASLEQVAAFPEAPVEEALAAVPLATEDKEKGQMPAVEKEMSTFVEDVKCTETKLAMEMMVEVMEETVNEIEPVSTELTAAS